MRHKPIADITGFSMESIIIHYGPNHNKVYGDTFS